MLKYLRSFLTVLAILLSGCEVPVALDEPIDVRVVGQVTDAETGAPLDSATVSILSGFPFVNEEAHATMSTAADGRYELNHRFVSECPSDLRVAAFGAPGYGFDSASERLECEDGTRRVDLELVRKEDGARNAADRRNRVH